MTGGRRSSLKTANNSAVKRCGLRLCRRVSMWSNAGVLAPDNHELLAGAARARKKGIRLCRLTSRRTWSRTESQKHLTAEYAEHSQRSQRKIMSSLRPFAVFLANSGG